MMRQNLRGKRYISLVRCSTDEQADTSIPDQIALLDKWAEEHGMVKVGEEILDGVKGTVPALRKDIPKLVARGERHEYDVLLVQDLWRFTRCGTRHGFTLEYQLGSVGVEVVSASDDIPDGPAGELYRTFKYQAAAEHVRKLSHDSTRGQMAPILAGILPHSQRTPFGTDRLYLSIKDGTPKYKIRNLPDGRQLKLKPDADGTRPSDVLEEFEPNNGRRRHYIKQPDEKVALVPGARSDVELVRHIFKRRYVDMWGVTRIARELNSLGVVTPSGRSKWSQASLHQILLNPVYVGIGVCNRKSKALFYCRAPKQPQPAGVDHKVLVHRSSPPTTYRPRNEWHLVSHHGLEHFLDPELREMVRLKQFEVLERRALGAKRAVPVRDKHIDSPFFLKGILRSRQGLLPMSGSVSRPRKKLYRYYVVSQGGATHREGQGLNRQIPAEPLEQVVLERLREVLLDYDGLRQRIVGAVILRSREASNAADRHRDLIREKEQVVQEFQFILTQLGKLGQEVVKARTAQLEARLTALDEQITLSKPEDQPTPADAETIADAVINQIRELAKGIEKNCYVSIRRLLGILVGQMTVDLQTKKLEIEFRLPTWTLRKDVRLDGVLACKSTVEANARGALLLANFGCSYRKKRNDRCFVCSRVDAAGQHRKLAA